MTPEQAAAASHTGHLTDEQQVMPLYPPGYGPLAGRPNKINDGAPTKKTAAQKAADRAARKTAAGDKPPPTNKPKKEVTTRRPDGRLLARSGVPFCLAFQKGSCSEPCPKSQVHGCELCPANHATTSCEKLNPAAKAALVAHLEGLMASGKKQRKKA